MTKSKHIEPWYGFDLDGTLAEYDKFVSHTHIGKPITSMVNLVKQYLKEGAIVKIFTARYSEPDPQRFTEVVEAINNWCVLVFGQTLPITCTKDYGMVLLYDDRCKQVIPNSGILIENLYVAAMEKAAEESL
jgi:hypothetical protein